MSVPPAIDAALLALGRQSGLSSVLRTLESALDRAVLTAFAKSSPVQEPDIAKALEPLRQCLAFARSAAGGPGDATELPRLERLAALLEAFLPPPAVAERAPARPATPRAQHSGDRPAVPRPRPKPTLGRPYRTKEIVARILGTIAGLYDRRRHLLADVLALWRDLREVDRQLQNATRSVSWIEGAVLQPARAMLESADGEPERFAAAFALLHVGGAEAVLSFLSASSGAEARIGDGVLSALRLAGDSALWQQVVAISPPGVDANAYCLSWLADRRQLSADVLLERLDDPSGATAIRAAELLAWLGRPPGDTRLVEGRLRHGVGEGRLGPFLYAAAALGSLNALEEIRRRIDKGEPITAHAVEALAVGGSARDSQRLLQLASRDEALAPLALLAAGHLGDRAAAAALAAGVEPPAAAERARRTILDGDDGSGPAGARLLYGKAWTLSGALARLEDPNELVRARSWYALEVAVRTGARPLAVLDASARVFVQDAAGARIRAAIEEWRRPIPSGAWFYFGQPSA